MSKQALVFGPRSYGRYSMHHLYGEQEYLNLKAFMKFWRYNHQLSDLLKANL